MGWELSKTLECQRCGTVVRRLSTAEAQKVSETPFAYIIYCTDCLRDGAHLDDARKDGLR